MYPFNKTSTDSKVRIIPDEEETTVNTERVLTLKDLWTVKAYRKDGRLLDQVNLGNGPLAVLISPI